VSEQWTNSCKRGEQEWTILELDEDESREAGDTSFEISDIYWIAGESEPGQDAYGGQPVALVYSEDDAKLIHAAPDMRDFIREAYEKGLLSEWEQYQRAKAILEKVVG
jgi:hypothetical protein